MKKNIAEFFSRCQKIILGANIKNETVGVNGRRRYLEGDGDGGGGRGTKTQTTISFSFSLSVLDSLLLFVHLFIYFLFIYFSVMATCLIITNSWRHCNIIQKKIFPGLVG